MFPHSAQEGPRLCRAVLCGCEGVQLHGIRLFLSYLITSQNQPLGAAHCPLDHAIGSHGEITPEGFVGQAAGAAVSLGLLVCVAAMPCALPGTLCCRRTLEACAKNIA